MGITLLALGLISGGAGVALMTEHLVRAGVLVSVPGATALVCGAIRRERHTHTDELADAHRAGYVLALQHVRRGLLDQRPDPTPDRAPLDDRAGSVRRLFLTRDDDDKRQAG
ncbi:hypothetical protein [Streptomyces sp. NPDC003278]|uniref:hypothetical protein n=1 Tax=Streptomyces sp. NPDC003278 TaxID=3364679 RepID=UPI003678DA5F